MNACTVEALPGGGYRVTRDFTNKAAAMAAMMKVLSVVEESFVPVAQEIPLPPAAGVRIAAAENED
jgi:hypothetical protein